MQLLPGLFIFAAGVVLLLHASLIVHDVDLMAADPGAGAGESDRLALSISITTQNEHNLTVEKFRLLVYTLFTK
jgi:uncharacterized glyoxalase superfamily protein PhnB